jgi:hypothetical protein
MAVDQAGTPVAGTATGYLELIWTGTQFVDWFFFQDFSTPVRSLFLAATTPNTSDDYAILNSALFGDDLFDLSNGEDVAYSLSGNDEVYLRGGDDFFDAGSGNDRIFGGLGSDTIIGGDGTDIVFFEGSAEEAIIGFGRDGTVFLDSRSGNGFDSLRGVERIDANGTIFEIEQYSSAIGLTESQLFEIAEVYVAYFDRAADAKGLLFWADKVAEGLSINQASQYFFESPESASIYGDGSNLNLLVATVYENVLGRTPDAAGREFWTQQIESGAVSRSEFVLEAIRGAKAGTSQGDRDFLYNKTALGLEYSIVRGLSDTEQARAVTDVFGPQGLQDTRGALELINQVDATTAEAFEVSLVGVFDDLF